MHKDIDLMFLTGVFPKENYKDVLENSKGPVQNAANNLQWELIEGFDEILDSKFSILNSMFIGSYPKRYRKVKIKKERFYRSQNAKEKKITDINTDFLNIPLYKFYSKYNSLIRELNLWINKNTNGKKRVLVIYAMTGTNLKIAEYVKRKNSDIHVSLIVPDLPEYMNLNPSVMHKIFKKIEIKNIEKNLKYIDSFTFLTEHMSSKISNIKPHVIVEGIAPNNNSCGLNISEKYSLNNLENTILYTGGLDKNYGIIELVNNFMDIKNPDYKLIICGAGPEEDFIKKYSCIDQRITYLGLLPREEVLYLQRNCTLLINPRLGNEEYTKYSFPSKLLEYMSSKRPVAAYMLKGMPAIYKKYIVELNKDYSLATQMEEILKLPPMKLNQYGQESFNFVSKYKNKVFQSNKILEMIIKNINKGVF